MLRADAAGGVVAACDFHGSIDFGGGPVVSHPWSVSLGEYIDVCVARFDSLGEHTWSRVVAGATYMRAQSLTIDAQGNLVMVGDFRGTADFGGVSLTSTFADAFVAKFDPDGDVLWAKRFGLSGPLGNVAEDVAIDADGNIVVIGTLSGRMDFGGGVIQSFGSWDVFLVKLDSAGGHVWTRRFGSAGNQQGTCLAIDGRGHLIVAGHVSNSIDLGGGPLATNGDQEAFVADLDDQGGHMWSRVIHGQIQYIDFDIDASASGRVAVGLLFGNSIDLGDGEVLYGQGSLVAVYDVTGAYRWKFYPEHQGVFDATFDDHERLVVCGLFSGLLDIGGQRLASVGDTDGYIARFDADGAFEWVTQVGGDGRDAVTQIVDAGHDVRVMGGFDDGIDLGDSHYDGSATFLARFGHVPPAPVVDVSLFPSAGAIEVRWNVTTEQPLDTLTILRGTPPASLQPIFTTPFGAGNGSFVDHDVAGGRAYQYQLVVTTPQGVEFRSSTVTATATVPTFANTLAQNAPNPFNPSTSINYSVSARAEVAVEIFDVSGVRVRRIEEGVRDAGAYAVEWNGRDDAGNVVGTGVYFYRLDGVGGVAPKKMVLLK